MKKLLLIAWLFANVYRMQAQLIPNCQIIDINNISASFASDGMIALRMLDTTQQFEVPKGSGVQALFAGTLWMGGLDAGENLHLAANRYYQNGRDFFPGPVATVYNAAYDQKYNRVWKIDAAAIQYHIQHYTDGGYTVPAEIADWPAHGNQNNGEAFYLAPFVDVNNNHYYDPANGDYPFIKGDEALYLVYNDLRDLHTESSGMQLGVEVHQMIYGYTNPTVNSTIFINTRIFNRSANNYHDVVVGSWNDFDLGCFNDDLVGCDTVMDAFFCYNGVGVDAPCMGANKDTTVMPSIGVTFLNTALLDFAYFTNGAPASMTDPSNAPGYWNYMNCTWINGMPFTHGGTGYNSGAATCYLFSGNPCDTADWSDLVYSGLPPGDRRAVGNTGKFSLPAGSNICFDMAYVYAEGDANSDCLANGVTALKQSMQDVKQFYQENQLGCFSSYLGITKVQEVGQLNCFPNPASNTLTIDLGNMPSGNFLISIIDMQGTVVYTQHSTVTALLHLEVSPFAKGIYAVHAKGKQGVYTQKVVIE
ncbi:MAG: T9SS type A sorting domain-containing protein [Chitinophagales bacterium]|nr:T9SS type A sorting domain-containing protein [Chitinophagales bacterium]